MIIFLTICHKFLPGGFLVLWQQLRANFSFFAAPMSHLENVLMAFQNVQSKLINGEAGMRWVRIVYNDGIFNLNKE